MSNQSSPPGWDGERMKQLLSHYEGLSDDEQVARLRKTRKQLPSTPAKRSSLYPTPCCLLFGSS